MFRRSQLPPALINLGRLIEEGKITKGLHYENISEENKYEAAADLYRKSRNERGMNNLALLIEDRKIKKGLHHEDISEENKYEAAADLYRKSQIPAALNNLALLIDRGHITKGPHDEEISAGNKNEVTAELYRQSQDPVALWNLSELIRKGKITKGLNYEEISEENKHEVIADLYRTIYTRGALANLASLIDHDEVTKGLNYEEISEENKYKVIEDLLHKSQTREALNNLAIYISEGKITRGLNYEEISEENKYEVMINLYELSGIPGACLNHALLLLERGEHREKALDLLLKASLGGNIEAREYYEILSKEMEMSISLAEGLNENEEGPILVSNEEDGEISDPTFRSLVLPSDKFPPESQFQEAQAELLTTEQKDSKVNQPITTFPSVPVRDELIIQEQTEHRLPEVQADQLSTEVRKKLKALKKAQKKQYFKKLVQGKFLSPVEKNSLMKASKIKSIDLKPEIKVELSPEAKLQLRSLSEAKKNKVWLLIDDIKTGGKRGRPEQLINARTLEGENLFSRRMTQKDRLVYTLSQNVLTLFSCKGHYDD